jgi:hypothetical protein
MKNRALTLAAVVIAAGTVAVAQDSRPKSPRGSAETQIGAHWIEISYGRPIKRGRTGVFADAAKLNAGAPVWRAGADVATRLKTPVALQIGGKTVPAGEYSLYIDLKDWTLIVSSWPAQTTYNKANKEALWGAYGYTPDKDVARVQMTAAKLPMAIDQLTWGFADVTATGGKLVIMWDDTAATAPFTIASTQP